MANRYPLVLDTTDGNKIKELPEGDNLYLRTNSIEEVQNINALGTINAANITIGGQTLQAQTILNLTDTPDTFTGAANQVLKVRSTEDGIDFVDIADLGDLTAGTINLSEDIIPVQDNVSNLGTNSRKYSEVRSYDLFGNLRGYDGTLVFNATTSQLLYGALIGAPTSLSEFTNDTGYVTIGQVSDYLEDNLTISDFRGSVFADDSTILVDGVAGRINPAAIFGEFGGEVSGPSFRTPELINQTDLLITTDGPFLTQTIDIQPGGTTSFVNIIAPNIQFLGDIVNRIQLEEGVDVKKGITGDLTGSVYYDDSTQIIDAVSGRIVSPTVSGTSTFEGNVNIDQDLTISGNLTVQGTTTSVETTNTTIKDNVITLNEGEAGAGVSLVTSGIEIDRGSESNVSLLWNDTLDKWTFGSQTLIAATFEGALTGNVTGDVQGNVTGNTNGTHTGSVIGNVTGDLTGNVVGDVVGSVFGDDSTPLVDAVLGKIVGDLVSTRWDTDSYTRITVNGLLEIEPQFFQVNSQADGYMQFNAGDGEAVGGGYVQINAGDGGSGVLGTGGYVQINAGDGSGSNIGSGGYVRLRAGNASATGTAPAGYVLIEGGAAQGGNISGGYVQITAGDSTGNSAGSYIQITGGSATNGPGGETRINGGTSINGNGGDVRIEGGTSSNGSKGSVIIDKAIVTGNLVGNIDNLSLGVGTTTATTITIGNVGSTTTVNGTIQFTNALIANNLTADDSISITTAAGDGNGISIGPQGTNTSVNLTADQIRFFGPITTNIDATGGVTGDVKGSVFGDDSSVIVDAVNNEIIADKVITPRVENTSTLTLFSDADIIMNASTSAYIQASNGNFNVVAKNGAVGLSDFSGAGNISISDLDGSINLGTTGTITIQGAAGAAINIGSGTSGTVTLGNGSNTIDIAEGSTVDFTNVNVGSLANAIIDWVPIVTGVLVNNGLPILPTQTLDISGSVFADDSTLLIDAVNGEIVAPIRDVEVVGATDNGSSVVDTVNPAEYLVITVNGNTRYIPLFV